MTFPPYLRILLPNRGTRLAMRAGIAANGWKSEIGVGLTQIWGRVKGWPAFVAVPFLWREGRMASRELKDASPVLVGHYLVIKTAFEQAFPKFELRPTCTYRSPDEQMLEFAAKRSALDGVTRPSKHNLVPAKAIDIGIFQKNRVQATYLDDLLEAGSISQDLFNALYWIVGLLAQSKGLRSGADWRDEGTFCAHKPTDPYHIEVRL